MGNYTTFIRSARSYEEYSRARKIVVERGLTLDQAHAACREFNADRTSAQIAAGTKMEFTSGEVH